MNIFLKWENTKDSLTCATFLISSLSGPPDDSAYILGALNIQTNITTVVLNDDENLEPGPLASSGLLLHQYNP